MLVWILLVFECLGGHLHHGLPLENQVPVALSVTGQVLIEDGLGIVLELFPELVLIPLVGLDRFDLFL